MANRRTVLRAHLPAALVLALAGLAATSPPASAAGETCFFEEATIVGSGTIEGTPGVDIIVGSPGADYIDGGGGNDYICAGAGNDTVVAGSGSDAVSDGAGADTVTLGEGDDVLVVNAVKDPRDVIDGGLGRDNVIWFERTAALKVLLGTTAADDGESGEADKLLRVEAVTGGSGNDTLVGSAADNYLDGQGGNDRLNGGPGADYVLGGTGDDVITEDDDAAPDVLHGSEGIDEISYASRVDGVTIDLGGLGASGRPAEGDHAWDFENARGGRGDDLIFGLNGSVPNKLWGGDGDDEIYDGLAADVVDGGNGCDLLYQYPTADPGDVLIGGGGSCDTLSYGERTDAVTIRLNTTTAVQGAPGEGDIVRTTEHATGGDGADTITGTGSANRLVGGSGADVLLALGGADELDTTDFVAGNDTGDGGAGNDVAYGDPMDVFTKVEIVF